MSKKRRRPITMHQVKAQDRTKPVVSADNSTGALGGVEQGLFGGPDQNQSTPQIDTTGTQSWLGAGGSANISAQNQAQQLALQTAQGKGPSAATAAAQQQGQQAMSNANALAASGSGQNGQGAARRQAMTTGANQMAQVGQNASVARAQEQLGGESLYGNLAGQARGQDISSAGITAQQATAQGQLTEQQNQLNEQAAQYNSTSNQNLPGQVIGAIGGAAGAIASVFDGPMDEGGGGSELHLVEPGKAKGSHWILREEPDFLLAKNVRSGGLFKVPMVPLTPEEHKQAMAPHGAGPLGGPGQIPAGARAGVMEMKNTHVAADAPISSPKAAPRLSNQSGLYYSKPAMAGDQDIGLTSFNAQNDATMGSVPSTSGLGSDSYTPPPPPGASSNNSSKGSGGMDIGSMAGAASGIMAAMDAPISMAAVMNQGSKGPGQAFSQNNRGPGQAASPAMIQGDVPMALAPMAGEGDNDPDDPEYTPNQSADPRDSFGRPPQQPDVASMPVLSQAQKEQDSAEGSDIDAATQDTVSDDDFLRQVPGYSDRVEQGLQGLHYDKPEATFKPKQSPSTPTQHAPAQTSGPASEKEPSQFHKTMSALSAALSGYSHPQATQQQLQQQLQQEQLRRQQLEQQLRSYQQPGPAVAQDAPMGAQDTLRRGGPGPSGVYGSGTPQVAADEPITSPKTPAKLVNHKAWAKHDATRGISTGTAGAAPMDAIQQYAAARTGFSNMAAPSPAAQDMQERAYAEDKTAEVDAAKGLGADKAWVDWYDPEMAKRLAGQDTDWGSVRRFIQNSKVYDASPNRFNVDPMPMPEEDGGWGRDPGFEGPAFSPNEDDDDGVQQEMPELKITPKATKKETGPKPAIEADKLMSRKFSKKVRRDR